MGERNWKSTSGAWNERCTKVCTRRREHSLLQVQRRDRCVGWVSSTLFEMSVTKAFFVNNTSTEQMKGDTVRD